MTLEAAFAREPIFGIGGAVAMLGGTHIEQNALDDDGSSKGECFVLYQFPCLMVAGSESLQLKFFETQVRENRWNPNDEFSWQSV